MSIHDFRRPWPENATGSFYVGNECTDCDLCRELAPTIFARNSEHGYSFVIRQPSTEEEISAARYAVEGCCVETIHTDGNEFDPLIIAAEPNMNYPKGYIRQLFERIKLKIRNKKIRLTRR